MTTRERHDRNVRFFGAEGQDRLWQTSVTVVGVGGLGTHVVQQLSLLGTGRLTLIDPEELDETNRNRYVGARADDPVPGTLKVQIGRRIAHEIDPRIRVEVVPKPLIDAESFEAIKNAEYVLGCLDNDGARLVLTELCAAYSRPYIDLATEIAEDGSTYGGRVVAAWDGSGCAVCYEQLDIAEAQTDLESPEQRGIRASLYGIAREALGRGGPSVVSINGVVASLGVTELMLAITGVRPTPRGLLTYRAHMGVVSVRPEPPLPDCYYCIGMRGEREAADVERYLASVERGS
jgi:hypothetical protein